MQQITYDDLADSPPSTKADKRKARMESKNAVSTLNTNYDDEDDDDEDDYINGIPIEDEGEYEDDEDGDEEDIVIEQETKPPQRRQTKQGTNNTAQTTTTTKHAVKKEPIKSTSNKLKIDSIKGKGIIPIPKVDKLVWTDGIKWLNDLTDEQWRYIQIYMYRSTPEIDTSPKYQEIFTGTDYGRDINFTREYMVAKHGGGKYSFTVQDTSVSPSKKILVITLDIPLSEADPILDYSTLVLTSKANQGYIKQLKMKGILDADGGIPVKKESSGDVLNNALLEQNRNLQNKLIDIVTSNKKDPMDEAASVASLKAVTGTIDMMLERVKKDNLSPIEMFKLMNEMNAMSRAANGQESFGTKEMVMLIMQMNESQNKLMMEMMAKQAETAANIGKQEKDDDDTDDKFMKRLEGLKAFGVQIGTGKTSAVDKLIEILPAIFGPVAQAALAYFGTKMQQEQQEKQMQAQVQMMNQQANQQQNQPIQPTQPRVHQDPRQEFILPSANQPPNQPSNQPIQENQQTIQQSQQAQQNQPVQEMDMKTAQKFQLRMLIENYHPRIYDLVLSGLDEDSSMKDAGEGLASSIDMLIGQDARIQLQLVETETYLEVMAQVPVFWVKVSPMMNDLKEFIEAFKGAFREDEKESK